jgi:CRISPR-associated endonuclease/helicase Cas3
MNYYAHSLEGQPPEKWQSLDSHLLEVARKAELFALPFNSGNWAYNAGLLHDLGKAAGEFQAYLFRENGLDDLDYDTLGAGRVNHSSAGAALAEKQFGEAAGRALAYLVAGHHAGLPDWFPDETGNAALKIREEEGTKDLKRIRRYVDAFRSGFRPLSHPPSFLKPDHAHLWMRMLFSCLVDADFLDTEAFLDPDRSAQRKGFASIPALKQVFDDFMSRMEASAPKTDVNDVRREVLSACRAAALRPPGLFTLTVPTGGGKTLSAMAFALDHAVRHDKRRILYVIPYTSIIEQTADILRRILGSGNVVEHHSNLDLEKETPRARLASENWDAPVIVTTNVQLFESLFAAKPGRCRKLHNIVDSVIILDEAQLLPPRLVDPCVDVMNALSKHYGVSIVLSTATQPALTTLSAPCPKLDSPCEIVDDPESLYDRLKRTEIHFPESLQGPLDWPSLARRIQEHEQVLCVVNSRRDCRELFGLMPEGTLHLSALMCGAHRSAVIRLIKWRLRMGRPVRVISTQLVEAGVDIDFPVVYRALAGIDSIAQAAGRCNREGRLNASCRLGEVHVFVPPKPPPKGLLLKGKDTTCELAACDGIAMDDPGTFARYFNLFYSKVNDRGEGFRDWLVRDVNPGMKIQFRTAAENFKIIDDQAQRPVFVRYGKGAEWIDRLRREGPNRERMRRLQRYTVNLPARRVEAMLADGRLERVSPRLAPDIVAQCGLDIYDRKFGLDVFADRLPIEDLVV